MIRRHSATHRPVHLNAIQRAIERARKLSIEDQENLKRICTHAFTEFCAGRECMTHWKTAADALNVAEQLSELGIVSDFAGRQRIAAGQAVLVAVIERCCVTGSWTLWPLEMRALSDALWMHRVQLEHCSAGEYERARKRLADKASQALAGNAAAGTQIVQAPNPKGPSA